MKAIIATAATMLLLLSGCSASTPDGTQAAAPESTSAAAQKTSEASEPETADSAYAVTIDGSHQTKDYEGNPALVVDFTFANNSDEASMFLTAVSAKAFQNGVELEMAMIIDDKKYDAGLGQKEIKPGAKTKVQSAWVLTDKSEVTIELSEAFSFSDDLIATKKIAVK